MTTLMMEMLRHFLQSLRAFTGISRLPQGVSLIVLSAAVYGLTMVVTKGALEHLPPITLLTIQTASSVTFFWAIVFLQGIQVSLRWNTFKAGFPGLLEPGLSYLFGMFGLSLTTASNATFIGTMEPVVTIALSWLILKERISKLLIGLGLVACLGVAIVAAPDAASAGQGSIWGDALVFLSVVFASLYAISTSRSIKHLAPVVLAAMQQSFALLFFLVMMIGAFSLRLETIVFTSATWFSLLVAVASGAFGYGTAFLLYLAALRHQTAGRTSVYLTLIPIFGVLGAYVLLGERLLLSQGLGGGLILLAIIGISRASDQVTVSIPNIPDQDIKK
jgi:drug/metabolite transporter (DMT)-like permease